MSVQVEKLEGSMAKLTITVEPDVFEKAVESAYQKNKGRINIQGFRKGKAPRKMIEKIYGPEVFYEDAANICIPDEYEKAYDECGLSDEMNAALGYSGQFVAEPPKEET